MQKSAKAFWSKDSGATTIEYGLVGALMALAIIAASSLVGSRLKLTFYDIVSNLSAADLSTADRERAAQPQEDAKGASAGESAGEMERRR